MSVRSLAALAVARDKAEPGKVPGGGRGEAATVLPDGTVADELAGRPAAEGGVPQQFSDVLVSAIPSEPLAAYTALVGVTVGAVTADTQAYLPFRWCVYAVFLVVVVAAVWVAYYRAAARLTGPGDPVRRRTWPLAEIVSALLAGGAWGLAMPGSPLNAQLSGTTRVLTVACIVIGSATVLSLVQAPQLKSGSNTTTKPSSAGR